MKLLAFGDAHAKLPDNLPPHDIVLIAGDIGPDGTPDSQASWFATTFRRWLEQRREPVLVVAGNHDHVLCQRPDLAKNLPCHYLVDEEVGVGGLRIYGSPWVYHGHEHDFYRTDEWMAEKWHQIPEGLDVLLLHCPPRGYGDMMNNHLGSQSLKDRLLAMRSPPKLILSGHNHDSRGHWFVGDSILVNATLGHHGTNKRHGPWAIDWRDGVPRLFSDADRDAIRSVPRRYLYRRVGLGERDMVLLPDGMIGEGSARCERQWRTRWTNRKRAMTLIISGEQENIMYLSREAGGVWRGRWENYERCPVELIPYD